MGILEFVKFVVNDGVCDEEGKGVVLFCGESIGEEGLFLFL